jgi:hypothetical protein
VALSQAQEAEILALLLKQGGLSLTEIEDKVRPGLTADVWQTLEFARRQGYITPAPPHLPDGSPAPTTVWLLTPAGREFVTDLRSPFSRRARRLATEVGNQLARTWIPIVILITIGVAIEKKDSAWNWIILAELLILGPGALFLTALINRRVRRSVLAGQLRPRRSRLRRRLNRDAARGRTGRAQGWRVKRDLLRR